MTAAKTPPEAPARMCALCGRVKPCVLALLGTLAISGRPVCQDCTRAAVAAWAKHK